MQICSPFQITMSIAPTSDGEYTPDDQDIIFVTGSGCMSDVPEDCTPQAAGKHMMIHVFALSLYQKVKIHCGFQIFK